MSTIVSCYYKFPSKHSHEKYDEWMNNFLLNIPNPIVIFTSPDLVSYIMSKRMNFLKNTHIIARPFEELELYKELLLRIAKQTNDLFRSRSCDIFSKLLLISLYIKLLFTLVLLIRNER